MKFALSLLIVATMALTLQAQTPAITILGPDGSGPTVIDLPVDVTHSIQAVAQPRTIEIRPRVTIHRADPAPAPVAARVPEPQPMATITTEPCVCCECAPGPLEIVRDRGGPNEVSARFDELTCLQRFIVRRVANRALGRRGR